MTRSVQTKILSLLTDCICVSRVTAIDGHAVRLSNNEVSAVVVHVVIVVNEVRRSDIPLGRQPIACCARGGLVERAGRLPALDAQYLVGGEGSVTAYPRIHSQDRRLVGGDLCAERVASFILRNGIRYGALWSRTVCLYEDSKRRSQNKQDSSGDGEHGKAVLSSRSFFCYGRSKSWLLPRHLEAHCLTKG